MHNITVCGPKRVPTTRCPPLPSFARQTPFMNVYERQSRAYANPATPVLYPSNPAMF